MFYLAKQKQIAVWSEGWYCITAGCSSILPRLEGEEGSVCRAHGKYIYHNIMIGELRCCCWRLDYFCLHWFFRWDKKCLLEVCSESSTQAFTLKIWIFFKKCQSMQTKNKKACLLQVDTSVVQNHQQVIRLHHCLRLFSAKVPHLLLPYPVLVL